MKMRKLIKEIKGVFKLPIKKYYFGILRYGTPYFWPINFNKHIISIRILKLKDTISYEEYVERYPHLKDTNQAKFSNLPIVRRSKDWVFKIFGKNIWLEIGWPFAIRNINLGWKDKFGLPRHEWPPAFYIFFFYWQFCIFWNSPDGNNDKYYEMILWYLHYSDKDLYKAINTWDWTDYKTGLSTWNNNYLI